MLHLVLPNIFTSLKTKKKKKNVAVLKRLLSLAWVVKQFFLLLFMLFF